MFKRNTIIISSGVLAGLIYGLGETLLDRYTLGRSREFLFVHDLIEWIFPMLIGLGFAFVVKVYIQQKELNEKLSAEMVGLKSKILTNTFASYILHEIRNPIHNLNAVLEKNLAKYPQSEKEVLIRNMEKLATITQQLKHTHVISEQMDVEEAVDFASWWERFFRDSIESSIKKSKIRFEKDIALLKVKMHPLLLEQCFQLLFDNAIRACMESPERFLSICVKQNEEKKDFAEIVLSNSGALFSQEMIDGAGRRRAESPTGSGLGLVLVRDTLKYVGGEIYVKNNNGYAEVNLCLPLART